LNSDRGVGGHLSAVAAAFETPVNMAEELSYMNNNQEKTNLYIIHSMIFIIILRRMTPPSIAVLSALNCLSK